MKLLDQLRRTLRAKHMSPNTEEAYVGWVKRYVRFHGTRHPKELGEAEITQFLTHLAMEEQMSASTQNQAKSALLFLYREALSLPLPDLATIPKARSGKKLPTVLTRREVSAVLSHMTGAARLVAVLLYGSGLRLMEALALRVKDLDLERGELTVKEGKGRHDRITMIPASTTTQIQAQLEAVRGGFEEELKKGGGYAPIPGALERKAPSDGRAYGWQYPFPASRSTENPTTGRTTMLYTHVLNRGGLGVQSPMDRITPPHHLNSVSPETHFPKPCPPRKPWP